MIHSRRWDFGRGDHARIGQAAGGVLLLYRSGAADPAGPSFASDPVSDRGGPGLLVERLRGLYSGMGRPSIAPEMLLRAMLLQAFYSIRSGR